MRQFAVLMLGIGVAVAAPSVGYAQDKESEAIIDKAIKAHGGADKLAALDKAATIRAKGNIEFMEMKLDFTLEAFVQPPGKSKAVIQLSLNGMQFEIIQVFDGDKGWNSVAGQVKDSEKEEIDENKHTTYIESVSNLLTLKKNKGFQLSSLGEAKVNDVPCVGVQVKKDGQRDVNLYFDKKSFLLLKSEYRALDPFTKQEVNQEKFFSDYKELVPGVKAAGKHLILNDGKRFMEVEVTDITSVDRHDDSIFAKPK
jgi:hypothetical protein